MFPTYLVSTRLLARDIDLVRILRKSKKQVQYHTYRYFFEYVCIVFAFFANNFVWFLVYESAVFMRRWLIFVISMSGLTPPSVVVINNMWHGWRRWTMMYASPSVRKQNERDVETVLAMNDGCCSGPFHSDRSNCLNKLCSFPANILRVCFGGLF